MTLYQHDGARLFRFELRGDLLADLARELEDCWRTASSTFGSRDVVVDVTAVSTWDDAGLEVLLRLREKGVKIRSLGKDQRLLELVDRLRPGDGKSMVA